MRAVILTGLFFTACIGIAGPDGNWNAEHLLHRYRRRESMLCVGATGEPSPIRAPVPAKPTGLARKQVKPF